MPQRRNEMSVQSRGEPFAQKYDYQSGINVIYEGYAVPGSATSDAVWLIAKNTYDASNNLTAVQWVGSADYNQIWDNRTSLIFA